MKHTKKDNEMDNDQQPSESTVEQDDDRVEPDAWQVWEIRPHNKEQYKAHLVASKEEADEEARALGEYWVGTEPLYILEARKRNIDALKFLLDRYFEVYGSDVYITFDSHDEAIKAVRSARLVLQSLAAEPS